jgi:hypothetical protein
VLSKEKEDGKWQIVAKKDCLIVKRQVVKNQFVLGGFAPAV